MGGRALIRRNAGTRRRGIREGLQDDPPHRVRRTRQLARPVRRALGVGRLQLRSRACPHSRRVRGPDRHAHKEIKRLCKQKAAAATAQQPQFQEAIERRVDRLVADGELEREELADLKAAYGKEMAAIRAAKASAAQLVLQEDDAAIQKLRSDHKRIFNARVATLKGKRDNQLVDLEVKLDAGKAAIERMPISG